MRTLVRECGTGYVRNGYQLQPRHESCFVASRVYTEQKTHVGGGGFDQEAAESRETKKARGSGGVNLAEAVKMIPTPDANCWKGGNRKGQITDPRYGVSLAEDEALLEQISGQLNATSAEYEKVTAAALTAAALIDGLLKANQKKGRCGMCEKMNSHLFNTRESHFGPVIWSTSSHTLSREHSKVPLDPHVIEVQWVKGAAHAAFRWSDKQDEDTKQRVLDWYANNMPTREAMMRWCVRHAKDVTIVPGEEGVLLGIRSLPNCEELYCHDCTGLTRLPALPNCEELNCFRSLRKTRKEGA